ncbi:hypothetical protein SDJN03_19802, partial [Cucurbita argyrosperma subsp. sororia]
MSCKLYSNRNLVTTLESSTEAGFATKQSGFGPHPKLQISANASPKISPIFNLQLEEKPSRLRFTKPKSRPRDYRFSKGSRTGITTELKIQKRQGTTRSSGKNMKACDI